MPAQEEVDELVIGAGDTAGLDPVLDQLEGADDVVRVLWPGLRNFLLEDDLAGFLDLKFGAFDVIGEIGLEESPVALGLGGPSGLGHAGQDLGVEDAGQLGEEFDALGIVGRLGGAGTGGGGAERLRIASAEDGRE